MTVFRKTRVIWWTLLTLKVPPLGCRVIEQHQRLKGQHRTGRKVAGWVLWDKMSKTGGLILVQWIGLFKLETQRQ